MSTARKPAGSTADRAGALTALRGLIGALTQSARAIESRTGITNAQLFLLRQFAPGESISINELAARVHARQNTVSSVVGRLDAAGLVANVRSADDRRRAALSVTAKGRRLLARAPASPTELLVAALASLSPPDAAHLAEGLAALVAAFGLEVDDAPMLFEGSRRNVGTM